MAHSKWNGTVSEQQSVYPASIVICWLRPYLQPRRKCALCKLQPATYEWLDYADSIHFFQEHGSKIAVINIYEAWDRAAREQARGVYTVWETTYQCQACTVNSLSRLIGLAGDVITSSITRGEEQARQRGVEASLIVSHRAQSYDDEGVSSLAPVPNTTIEEVAEIVRGHRR